MGPSNHALSVYLVEDSEALASRLAELLEDELHLELVGQANDAATAISELTKLHPEVVLTDLGLRSGTGFDVLRALPKLDPVPVCLVLTNHSSAPYKRAAEQFGVSADRFFDKTEQMGSLIGYLRCLAEMRSESLQTGEGSNGRDHEQRDRRRSLQSPRRTRHA